MNRRDSIYLHLLELLLISAVLAGVCYFLLDCTGEYAVDTFYSNSDYVEQKNETMAVRIYGVLRSADAHSRVCGG